MAALTVLLLLGTIYRATRLVTTDTFPPIARFRAWAERRWPDRVDPADPLVVREAWFPYLLSCPWCMSIWLGAAIVAAADFYVSVPLPVLVWACGSAAAGLIASVEPE